MISTATLLEPMAPVLSVTVSVAVKFPADLYVCAVVAPVPTPPSPNCHANDTIVLPLGAVPEPLNPKA